MNYCKVCQKKTYIICLYYKGLYCIECYTKIYPKIY